jgi:hypothetical protein
VLTALGTVLGIGGFVAIVGLSQTASGQTGSVRRLPNARHGCLQ